MDKKLSDLAKGIDVVSARSKLSEAARETLDRKGMMEELAIRVPKPPPSRAWVARAMLIDQINLFETGLNPDQEVGGRLVSAPGDRTIHIEEIESSAGEFLIFSGLDSDGNPVKLIQHYTQLSILLVALKTKEDQPRRIGFHLKEKLAEEK